MQWLVGMLQGLGEDGCEAVAITGARPKRKGNFCDCRCVSPFGRMCLFPGNQAKQFAAYEVGAASASRFAVGFIEQLHHV